MSKQIVFVSPKFSNHIGGMETHGYEFARGFIFDSDFPLVSILVKNNITDGVQAPSLEDQDGVNGRSSSSKKLDSLVDQCLSGDFERDARTILDSYDLSRTIFFLNSPTFLVFVKIFN